MANKTKVDLVKRVFSKIYHSVFIAILGPNQSGKTVMGLYLMVMCHKLGLFKYYGTNIPDLDFGFPVDFIEDLPTLKERCQMLGADGNNRYLFLADEMGDWAPQDQPWLNVKFIKELQKVRKYGLSLIGCGIDRIDARILSPSYFAGKFVKRSKKQPREAVYHSWEHYPRIKTYPVHGLPNPKIKGYNTYWPSEFHMERKLDSLQYIPLTPEHKIVKDYLRLKSWKLVDVHPQEGKRAIMKVLTYHFENCLHNIEAPKDKPVITQTQVAS